MPSFPDRYIVLCRTFSTCMEMETETETETFPDGYCTHFRDRSPSQGQISVPILLYFNKGDWNPSPYQWKNLLSTIIHMESVSVSVSVGGNKPLNQLNWIFFFCRIINYIT